MNRLYNFLNQYKLNAFSYLFLSLPLISVKDGHGPYSNGGKFKCKPGILPPKNFVYYKDSLVCGACKRQYEFTAYIIPSIIVILNYLTSRII